jgi:hypothetical protein
MFGFFSRKSKKISKKPIEASSPASVRLSKAGLLVPVIVPRSTVEEAAEEPF